MVKCKKAVFEARRLGEQNALLASLGMGSIEPKRRTCLSCMLPFNDNTTENRICPRCKNDEGFRFASWELRRDLFFSSVRNLPSSVPLSLVEMGARKHKRTQRGSVHTYLSRCPQGITVAGLVKGTKLSDTTIRFILKKLKCEGKAARLRLWRGRVTYLWFHLSGELSFLALKRRGSAGHRGHGRVS